MSSLLPPVLGRTPFVDPRTGLVSREWLHWLEALVQRVGGTGAVVSNSELADVPFVVSAATAGLNAERVVTNSGTVTWDLSVAGQIRADAIAVPAEPVQDIVGAMAADSSTVDFTYDDAGGTLTAAVKDDSLTYAKLQNVSATDKLLGRQTAGAGDVEEIPCTAAGRALLDDADASAQRTTLGLGTLATQAANNVTITGGSLSGMTSLGVSAPQVYTPTNVTTDRAFDANATTVDEVADVLGTLITDLQARGILA